MKTNKTAKKMVRRQGEAVITTRKQLGDDPQTVTHERRVVDDLPEHTATVMVGGGLTKSTGPYESVKLSISISVPCAPDEATIRKTYKKVSALVGEMIDCEYEKVVE